MDNLPNELLCLMLSYLPAENNYECSLSSKLLFRLRQFIVANFTNYENSKINDFTQFTNKFIIRKVAFHEEDEVEKPIPKYATYVKFNSFFDKSIDHLGLTHVTFDDNYNRPINSSTLTHLIFYNMNPLYTEKLNIPNLKSLATPIWNLIPETVTHIKISNYLPHLHYPQSIKHMIIDFGLFDDHIKSLPKNITHLRIIGLGNPEFACPLPLTLTHISFGNYYNTKIITWPPEIIHIDFGDQYNIPVINLPKTVKRLIFGNNFNQSLDELPSGITHIKLGKNFTKQLPNFNMLTHLNVFNLIAGRMCVIPITVSHIVIQLTIPELSNNITHIIFGENFNDEVDNLPLSVINIKFGYLFNKRVDNLPSQLTHITFGKRFNKEIGKLPKGLTHLSFGRYRSDFSHSIEKIPHSV